MNQIKKSFKVIPILAIVFQLFFMCNKAEKENINLLIGSWDLKSVENITNRQLMTNEDFGCSYFQFHKNNQFQSFNGISEFTGKWRLEEDTLKLVSKGDIDRIIIIKIKSDSLSWISENDIQRLRFNFVKVDSVRCL